MNKHQTIVTVSKSREIRAPQDAVWDVITDASQERKYWTNIRDVKTLSEDGNTISREATVGPTGFAHRSHQRIVLEPKSSLKLTMSGETMEGERTISLAPVAEDGSTRVEVRWNFELKGVPGFVQGIVKNQISSITEKALAKIAEDAERAASKGGAGTK